MFKTTVTALLCTLGWGTLTAQSNHPVDHLRIGGGYVQNYYKDLNFSPLNYEGKGFGGQIEYQRFTKNKNLFFTELSVQYTNIEADISRFTQSMNIVGNINFGYLKRMNKANLSTPWYVGAVVHSYNNTNFFDGVEAISFYTLHGVDIATQFTQVLGPKHRFDLFLSVPVYGLLVRPPYTGWDKFIGDNESSPVKIFLRGDWTSVNDFQGVNFKANYQFDLTRRIDIDVQYRFSYYQTNILKKAVLPINQAGLGLTFKL